MEAVGKAELTLCSGESHIPWLAPPCSAVRPLGKGLDLGASVYSSDKWGQAGMPVARWFSPKGDSVPSGDAWEMSVNIFGCQSWASGVTGL